MIEVVALIGGLLVGMGLGLLLARPRERALRERLAHQERTLRERIAPAVERHARRLEIPVRSIPPLALDGSGKIVASGTTTADHLAEICERITERETADSLALSDTLQLASKDLDGVKKIRKGG